MFRGVDSRDARCSDLYAQYLVEVPEQDVAAAARTRCTVFDLRPTGSDDLMIYHGSSTGVTFDAAIAAMDRYLTANPSEACFVQMQFQSGKGNGTSWASAMGRYLASSAYRDRFLDFRSGLTLGAMRGKILILTRTDYDGTLVGGKITSWRDDVTDQTSSIVNGSASATLFIQDKYGGTTGIDNKKSAITAYLDKARGKKWNGLALQLHESGHGRRNYP